MILSLPTEIHTEIFKYLPRRDLLTMARVCKELSSVAVEALVAHVEIWDKVSQAAVLTKLSEPSFSRAVKAMSLITTIQ